MTHSWVDQSSQSPWDHGVPQEMGLSVLKMGRLGRAGHSAAARFASGSGKETVRKQGVAERGEQNPALFLSGKMSGFSPLPAVFWGVLVFLAVATEPCTGRCSIASVGLIPTGN